MGAVRQIFHLCWTIACVSALQQKHKSTSFFDFCLECHPHLTPEKHDLKKILLTPSVMTVRWERRWRLLEAVIKYLKTLSLIFQRSSWCKRKAPSILWCAEPWKSREPVFAWMFHIKQPWIDKLTFVGNTVSLFIV